MRNPVPLSPIIYETLVRNTLAEDLGRAGDLTTDALIDPNAKAKVAIVARKEGRLAGIDVALAAFTIAGTQVSTQKHVEDGANISPGQVIATIEGNARTILTAERTALNFLGHLCGVATITYSMSKLIEVYHTRLVCTRKTLPGLRALQKYAVRCGGAVNHRFGLDDAIMIKDNHIAVCGSITNAVKQARDYVGHMVKIEVEVDTLAQLEELLAVGADVVLLDNMRGDTLKQAVAMAKGKITTEASGGITAESIVAIAAAGVDYISAGFLTHSATNLDVGLDIHM